MKPHWQACHCPLPFLCANIRGSVWPLPSHDVFPFCIELLFLLCGIYIIVGKHQLALRNCWCLLALEVARDVFGGIHFLLRNLSLGFTKWKQQMLVCILSLETSNPSCSLLLSNACQHSWTAHQERSTQILTSTPSWPYVASIKLPHINQNKSRQFVHCLALWCQSSPHLHLQSCSWLSSGTMGEWNSPCMQKIA
jgi:hypothetical protein